MSTILTVSELTTSLRRHLEGHFPFVWVKGEVSNLSRPGSGHVYFSLKDNDALLNCVWFKGQQRGAEKFDPMTGEVFEGGPRPSLAQSLRQGQQLLCAGRITVYPPRGGYQLVVELVQEAGLGALHAAFEALRRKLSDLGYFAQERKRALPRNAQRVAVITAPTGAAVQDFLRIASTRGCGSAIRVCPVPVQGDAAAPAIVRTLEQIGNEGWAEVVVLIRGGGSLEDLWAFNEERVAEAVFHSPIPVLAGIGHEVDISMADMTADLRAATPTHAAQLLWPSRQELMQRVDGLEEALTMTMEGALHQCQEILHRKEQALGWLSPLRLLSRRQEGFAHHLERLKRCGTDITAKRLSRAEVLWQALPRATERHMDTLQVKLERLTLRLEALSPLSPLDRGYALVRGASGAVMRSAHEASKGQHVEICLQDGILGAEITRIAGQEAPSKDKKHHAT